MNWMSWWAYWRRILRSSSAILYKMKRKTLRYMYTCIASFLDYFLDTCDVLSILAVTACKVVEYVNQLIYVCTVCKTSCNIYLYTSISGYMYVWYMYVCCRWSRVNQCGWRVMFSQWQRGWMMSLLNFCSTQMHTLLTMSPSTNVHWPTLALNTWMPGLVLHQDIWVTEMLTVEVWASNFSNGAMIIDVSVLRSLRMLLWLYKLCHRNTAYTP